METDYYNVVFRIAITITDWKAEIFGLCSSATQFEKYRIRNDKGLSIFGNQVDASVMNNIVLKLLPLGQVEERESYNLGMIPNLHSLIPYSQKSHKPVYKCDYSDGLRGEHLTKASYSKRLYDDMLNIILKL